MRKFLNVSLLILVVCLVGSLGCRSWLSPEEPVAAEPGLSAGDYLKSRTSTPGEGLSAGEYLESRTARRPTTSTVGTTPAPTPTRTRPLVTEQTPSTRPDMVAVSESGSSIVSKTYPWAECGVVQLDKTMPKEVGLNKPFNYTIKVTNLTNATLNDIIVTEDLPEGFKYLSSNPGAQQDKDDLLFWEIATLGPKSTTQISISGMATYIDALRYCTNVVTPVIPACATVQVIQPELKLTRTAPDEVLVCDPIQVRYVVTNSGTGYVPNVKILETLPTGLRTTGGKSEIIFDAGTLMAGQSQQFSAELRATGTGEYVNQATATSTMGLRAESDTNRTVVTQPVLTVQKTGPDRQYIGRPVTYQITVTNKSNVAARNTVVEDLIPDGVNAVRGTAGAKLLGPKLVWELGTLEPGTSETVRISFTPTKAGTLINSSTASAYCAEAVTSTVRTVVTGIPAVLMEVVDVEDPVRVGERGTYVIRVKNQGSATATNIRVTCVLEDYVRFVSSAGATTGAVEGQTIRFLPLGTLAPQAEVAWRVVVEAVRAGDMRFKVVLTMDELTRPVEKTESTHLYD